MVLQQEHCCTRRFGLPCVEEELSVFGSVSVFFPLLTVHKRLSWGPQGNKA